MRIEKKLRLAKSKMDQGSISDAKEIFENILKKFPKNKRALDGLKFLKNIIIDNSNKNENRNRVDVGQIIKLYEQGDFQLALKKADHLLSNFPSSAVIYNVKGAIFAKLREFDSAIKNYQKAIKINPSYAEAFNNMGVALKDKGRIEEAIKSFKLALEIKPNYSFAYNNLGMSLKDIGERSKSIYNLKKAIKIDPNYSEAYRNIANTLSEIDITKPDQELNDILVTLLNNRTFVRPTHISRTIINFLKLNPIINDIFNKVTAENSSYTVQDIFSDLSKVSLLTSFMKSCPIPDKDFEILFMNLRAKFLLALPKIEENKNVLYFLSVLAQQCFTNEYVYYETEQETKAVNALKKRITRTFESGNNPSTIEILCFACYRVIHNYDWCKKIVVPEELEETMQRLVHEPIKEKRLSSQITVLNKITDKVSNIVRNQYEENPYPRWVSLGLRLQQATLSEVIEELRLNLSNDQIHEVSAPKILIAGCGTGQHSIETAGRFKDASITAIDLSLASLSYAKRKTEEFGFTNIEYIQADILELKKLGKTFDIIESVGVLHHMKNPLEGWKVLVDCLKTGGLINIGLYSKTARNHIQNIKKDIIKESISTKSEIRKIRNLLIKSERFDHEKIIKDSDFFSLSSVRDLLFHVQEHNFSLPKIKACLDELGLVFCGFSNKDIVNSFVLVNPDFNDLYDLTKWHDYEKQFPNIFYGMYQFWCQKL